MIHDTASLVDRLAQIRAEQKALDAEESDIRAAILKLEMNIVEGESFTAIIKAVTSSRLDTAAVKSEMGNEWYKAHTVPSTSIRIETVAKTH